MLCEKSVYEASCRPIFQKDFYNLSAVAKEMNMRNLKVPYDCLLEYMKYIALHANIVQEIVCQIGKSVCNVDIDDPFNFISRVGKYRNSYFAINKELKNDSRWIMVKELGKLWLNSRTIDEFHKRFERFVVQTTLNFGINTEEMIESIFMR